MLNKFQGFCLNSDDYQSSQYDVDKAQKYAYYYQGENSYYNQDLSKKSSTSGNIGGLIAIPFIIALFTFFKYLLTALLVPVIPSMFLGYKIALLLSEPSFITKILFILFSAFLGIVLQIAIVRVVIDFVFKKEFLKWLMYILLYFVNLYLIFVLESNFDNKDLHNCVKILKEIYHYIVTLWS